MSYCLFTSSVVKAFLLCLMVNSIYFIHLISWRREYNGSWLGWAQNVCHDIQGHLFPVWPYFPYCPNVDLTSVSSFCYLLFPCLFSLPCLYSFYFPCLLWMYMSFLSAELLSPQNYFIYLKYGSNLFIRALGFKYSVTFLPQSKQYLQSKCQLLFLHPLEYL